MKKYCIGVDLGGTFTKYGLFTEDGEIAEQWMLPTDRSDNGSHVLGDIAAAIKDKLAEKKISKEEIKGIGIGVPGPVTSDGTVMMLANLGWGIVNVNKELKELTGIEVRTGNDANVAALGEMWRGGGKGYKDIVLVTLGTGVGGGVVLDGQIRHGFKGGAGEIGHITVESDETDICGCGGRGHLEQYASASGIVRMAQKRLAADAAEETSLRDFKELTAKDIFDEAKKGDKVAFELVDKMTAYLALMCSHVAAVVDPQAFVIGGGVSKAGSIITESVLRHYNENLITVLKDREFKLAELGNDAGIYGAAKLVLDI